MFEQHHSQLYGGVLSLCHQQLIYYGCYLYNWAQICNGSTGAVCRGGTRSIYMAGLRPIWHTDYISYRPFTCPAWHSQGCEYDLIGYRSAPWGRLLRGSTYTGDGKLQEGWTAKPLCPQAKRNSSVGIACRLLDDECSLVHNAMANSESNWSHQI